MLSAVTSLVPLDLENKVALVTGAAGDIGRCTVERLRARGCRVVAADARSGVETLEQAGQIACVCGDLRDAQTAARSVRTAMDQFGALDILVNNAARFLQQPTLETSEAQWDEILDVNARGTFLHCREALKVMSEHGSGAIVNVASISGVIGLPGQAAYSASKGAIVQLTRVLAVEFAARGIRVNAVAPGAVVTGFLEGLVPDSRQMLASFGPQHPIGRSAQPEEIADVIAFLASPKSSFMTGAVVMVDGGFTAA
jgi:NAD(P)-dependent dehydrogenase (short-subunit alcohol dehydrogenase family)